MPRRLAGHSERDAPMPNPLLEELQETLHREMPITVAMEIGVEPCEPPRVAMSMPLEANHNHQFSAFAGSLNALCTAAGWGTVFLLLRQNGIDGNAVIRRSSIRYMRPVRCEKIVALADPLGDDDVTYFLELLKSKGQSKIDVSVTLPDREGPYLEFKGSYVVQDMKHI